MAFLDNSGDIILDAVLTDEGRRRLAQGNGSFRISKFALADDEVDYSLYTPVTSSGYEDLRILKLPIFEAFTNNISSVKSKLLTYADNTLFYLPVIKLNTQFNTSTVNDGVGPVGGYYVSVDSTTTKYITGKSSTASSAGFRYAQAGAAPDQAQMIFDQGLDTADLSLGYLGGENSNNQQRALYERGYLIEVDNRLLSLTTPSDQSPAQPSFVDDDNVATYYFSLNTNPDYFAKQGKGLGGNAQPVYDIVSDINGTRTENSQIGPTDTTGRIGSRLVFGLRSSLEAQTSTATKGIFPKLGGTSNITVGGVNTPFLSIDTVIRITGFNTGFRVEVPLKLLKYTS
jgi:hypothetical protein